MATTSIGAALKEARVKKAVSFEDVYSKIKIHPRVLECLEEDKFDKLPSPLFAKSFIKSYAEFLEINGEELLRQYERSSMKEPEQQYFIRSADEKMRKPGKAAPVDRRLILMPIFICLFVLGACVLLYAGKTLFSQLPKFEWKSVSRPAKKPVAVPQKPVASKANPWLRSVAQGNFPEIGSKEPLSLQLKALDNVWLRITCDSKVIYQAILKRGAAEAWKADHKIEIWTGNSSNMFLTLNNTNLGSPGKGVIKKMEITRDGVRIAK